MEAPFMVRTDQVDRETVKRFTDFLRSQNVEASNPFRIGQPDGNYWVIMTKGITTEELKNHFVAWQEVILVPKD